MHTPDLNVISHLNSVLADSIHAAITRMISAHANVHSKHQTGESIRATHRPETKTPSSGKSRRKAQNREVPPPISLSNQKRRTGLILLFAEKRLNLTQG